MIQTVVQTVGVQQLQFIDKITEILVLTQSQIPVAKTTQKTTEIPQLQHCENVVDALVEQV